MVSQTNDVQAIWIPLSTNGAGDGGGVSTSAFKPVGAATESSLTMGMADEAANVGDDEDSEEDGEIQEAVAAVVLEGGEEDGEIQETIACGVPPSRHAVLWGQTDTDIHTHTSHHTLLLGIIWLLGRCLLSGKVLSSEGVYLRRSNITAKYHLAVLPATVRLGRGRRERG